MRHCSILNTLLFTLSLSHCSYYYPVNVSSLLTTLFTLYTWLLNNLFTYSLTLRWLASQLRTYTLVYNLFKQRPPFTQPWGALKYKIYPAVLFTYIWGPSPNVMQCLYLKKTKYLKYLFMLQNVYCSNCSTLHCSWPLPTYTLLIHCHCYILQNIIKQTR